MITKNEKAKGLWWRLLATLPVLAILMIANTKVAAQEQMINPNPPVDADTYQIVMYEYDDSDRLPINDTVVYNDDGSYTEIKRERERDPETGGMRTKVSLSTYDKKGKPISGFHISTEPKQGDTSVYHITPIEGFHFPAEVVDNDTVYQVVDQKPEFPGGERAMMEFLSKNIVYPEKAKEAGIQGRVFVGFVIEKDGSVSEVKIMKGVGGECDEEALRVVKSMPNWKPGKKDGKVVRVSYTLPINFKLTEDLTKKSDNTSEMKPDKNGVYQLVEEKPEFPGGEQAMMKYLSENIKYPEDAIEKNQAGRVFVSFVVGTDGSINEATILRGVCESIDNEALRVVNAMPKWTPGKVKGEPVKVQYTLPIVFKL